MNLAITRHLLGQAGPKAGEADSGAVTLSEANRAHRRPARPSWAKLLERELGLDLEHGPN